MILKHVALVCSSEANADKFYGQLLGLKKMSPKVLPRELTRQIFDVDSDYKMVNYVNDSVRFEIFINVQGDGIASKADKTIEHVCIEVEGLDAFLIKCRTLGIKVRQIPKGEKIVTFVWDDDGNIFEIN